MRKLFETGEWDDGEHGEWMEAVEDALKEIEEATNKKLKFISIRGVDAYQGPKARVNVFGKTYSVWDAQRGISDQELYIEDFFTDIHTNELGHVGTPEEIIELLNSAGTEKRVKVKYVFE